MDWGTVPGWITALAAIGGVVLAWWKVGQELDARRDERRDEREAAHEDARRRKQAEIAGQAIVSSLRMLETLRSLAFPGKVAAPKRDRDRGAVSGDVEQKLEADRQELAEEQATRWEAARQTEREFTAARELAATYLPDRANDVLEEIVALINRTWAAQQSWTTSGIYAQPGMGDTYKEAFGPGVYEKIDSARSSLLERLRPLARLEVEPKPTIPAKRKGEPWF